MIFLPTCNCLPTHQFPHGECICAKPTLPLFPTGSKISRNPLGKLGGEITDCPRDERRANRLGGRLLACIPRTFRPECQGRDLRDANGRGPGSINLLTCHTLAC
ncbi:hypothetical protein TNIN_76921 [Trichonephila inaurata madagascariensis]|uniref:Uncharacterized protein n=1 Tax=Trichonephila inaurata madagascariensis TaxID=2747483 RepID=A0A8X6WQI8_9ARAC|nr:hypothetical protein TNIN_76921 [Trichonephila inaurata madagascariensis]